MAQVQVMPRLFKNIGQVFTGKHSDLLERRRLEAFLGSNPSSFCGWNMDGTQAISPGFLTLLDIDKIDNIDDIDKCLEPADAISLREHFAQLQIDGEAFEIAVRTRPSETDAGKEGRTLHVRGGRGTDLEGGEHFDILWLTDVTEQTKNAANEISLRVKAEAKQAELLSALGNLPFPIWLRDKDKKITWSNRSYADIVDSKSEDVIKSQREIKISTANQLAEKTLETGLLQKATGHIVMGGTRRLVEVSELYLPHKEIILGYMQDLTRMEEAESELQRHIEAHGVVLENMGSAIAIYGPDQRIKFFNNAYVEMMALDETWLDTQPMLGEVLEVLREKRRLPETADFPSYKKKQLDRFTSLLKPEEDLSHLPSGAALRQIVSPHPFGGLLFNIEDISSRLALESSYNTLIAVQSETLNNLAEGVSVIGGDGRIRLWNPAFMRIWDISEDELKGEPHISDLIEKMRHFFDDRADWEDVKHRMIVNSLDRTARAGRMERADGSVLEYATVPLPDGAILNTILDVSDSVRVEQALREKNAVLEATDQVKTEFLANVSYKLRTPLNAIMGFTEILKENYFGELNKRQDEYVDMILSASNDLANLVNDVLDLATIEAGYMLLERKNIDIISIFDEAKNVGKKWAKEQEVGLEFKLPKSIGKAELDKKRMRQVVLNLISNAINFTPPGGKIIVSAATGEDEFTLMVKDNGVGIPVKDQERIFSSFERAQTNRTHPTQGQAGAGLGLTLVKNFVELHGGTVKLESTLGEGTIITCHIPLTVKIARHWQESGKSSQEVKLSTVSKLESQE